MLDKNLRIQRMVVFTKFFWPEGGGAELATYLVTRNILSKHFDVTIVSGTERPENDILRHCRYVHWPVLRAKYKPIEWLKLFANTRVIRRLAKNADIIYIPSHTLLPLAIVTKSISPDAKVVLHLHNYQPLTYTSVVLVGRKPDLTTDVIVERGEHDSLLRAVVSGLGYYINRVNALSLYFADKIICASKKQREILVGHVPAIQGKTTVVYNPPPPAPNIDKKPSDTPSLLFSGGGSFVKGAHIATKAIIRILAKYRCKIYLITAYSSNKDRFLEKIATRFQDKLIVLKKMPHKEYVNVHSHVWSLLFPSICEEPLPYAVVESCLLGTIPIASRVGGIPEIVKGTCAERFLSRPGDVEDLVDRIEQVLALSREELWDIASELKYVARKRFSTEETEKRLLEALSS